MVDEYSCFGQWSGRIYIDGKSKQREREKVESERVHGAAEEAICEARSNEPISLVVKHK